MLTRLISSALVLTFVAANGQSDEEKPNTEAQAKSQQTEKPQEHTVKAEPFSIETELSGILVPSKTQTFSLSPQRWKNFTIESVPNHGAEIKQGDALIVFKTEAIDKSIVDQKDSVKTQELKLAIANRELTELQQKNALSLAEAKRKMEHAEADLAYYEKTGQPARKESLKQDLQQAEDYLTYQKEELTQLLKMYEEDDITEETEEIILVRQKAQVRNAENNVTEQKRRNDLAINTSLPRELIELQTKVENARITYATAKLNLERKFELKKLEIAKLERTLTDTKTALSEMEADRELFDVTAEFDGNLLFGEFADGQWIKGKTPEFLKTNGTVPTETTILTLVASDSPLALQALLPSEEAHELQESLKESGEDAPEVELAPYPNIKGKHLVTLPAKPAEAFQFPGGKGEESLVFYQAENAITIPNNVVKTREDESAYVLVKLSEGDPEERTIQLGKKDDEVVEVLSGLEEGQVILP